MCQRSLSLSSMVSAVVDTAVLSAMCEGGCGRIPCQHFGSLCERFLLLPLFPNSGGLLYGATIATVVFDRVSITDHTCTGGGCAVRVLNCVEFTMTNSEAHRIGDASSKRLCVRARVCFRSFVCSHASLGNWPVGELTEATCAAFFAVLIRSRSL